MGEDNQKWAVLNDAEESMHGAPIFAMLYNATSVAAVVLVLVLILVDNLMPGYNE